MIPHLPKPLIHDQAMKRLLTMAGLLSLLTGLFSSGAAAKDYTVTEVYSGLRNMVLTTTPESVGVEPGVNEVWGLLMETGYPKAVVTLVALADGTVSIYFSNGGGIIGLGPHPGPQKAAEALISLAQHYWREGSATEKHPLPTPSHTRFYLLTGGETRTLEAKEEELRYGRHRLSPLFRQGHQLISEIRSVDEQRRAEQAAS